MDDKLKRLANEPLPARLAQLDDAILVGLVERQNEVLATSRLLTAAAVVALGVGYAEGSFMSSPASATEHRLVITETELAPSTLLDFL